MSLHLIDNDGHLEPEKKLTEFLRTMVSDSVQDAGGMSTEDVLSAVGVNYHVVGVFGGQSSGKSTLLNHLFRTDFQTLDERVRRGQTTKGAFMSRADTSLEGFEQPRGGKTHPPLMVLDFEGTDGLERGDDQSFERQLSLFGLSVVDTLIINMWAVDVGRFNAANLTLLRTIFEVNLQLFSHDSYAEEEKPTLLVVLRDFTEEDPAPSLATVRKSFDTIWEGIYRPEKFASSPIDDLFHLKYYVMPHFKLQRPEFEKSVVSLRRWFGDSHDSNYLFHHEAMFRGVLMQDLTTYLSNCWEAILTSKDLDIPTQREMLAQHRCKQVMEQELKNFQVFCRHYDERIGRGEMLLRLSEILEGEMETRIKEFLNQTKLYNAEVAKEFQAQLESSMVESTLHIVGRFSKAICAEAMNSVETRVQAVVDNCTRHLLKAGQDLPFLSKSAAAAALSAAQHADTTGEEGDDDAEAAGNVRGLGSDYVVDSAACQHLVRKFWKNLRRGINDTLAELAVSPPPAHIYGRYTTLVAQDPTARADVINRTTDAVFAKVRSRVAAMAENASDSMHKGFERCLTHNTDGTTKFFATTAGLQKASPPAQQAGMVLLGCLLYFRLRLVPVEDAAEPVPEDAGPQSRSSRRVEESRKVIEFRDGNDEQAFFLSYTTLDALPKYPLNVTVITSFGDNDKDDGNNGVCGDCVLLSQSAMERAFDLYRQHCDFTMQLQMRSIEAGKQRLPAWVLPTMLLLGWNELCYVLKSPTLLVLIIVIVSVFFKNWIIAQWQAFEESGPSTIVIPLQTGVRWVSRMLNQFSANATSSHAAAAPLNEPGSSQSPPTQARRTVERELHADPDAKAQQHGSLRQRHARKEQ